MQSPKRLKVTDVIFLLLRRSRLDDPQRVDSIVEP